MMGEGKSSTSAFAKTVARHYNMRGGTMTGPQKTNLTGIWQGLYTYPRLLQRVLFNATLIEAGAWVTGSTHEPCDHGPHKGQTLHALVEGQRHANLLNFKKTYEAGLKGYGVIDYEGTISDDATEIEGRWSIRENWGGKFLMIRSTGKEQAVDRKAFARI